MQLHSTTAPVIDHSTGTSPSLSALFELLSERDEVNTERLPRPASLVLFPIVATTRNAPLLELGKSRTSSNHTLGVVRSSMRPTMPFQLPWVWSEILWEFTPTSTT